MSGNNTSESSSSEHSETKKKRDVVAAIPLLPDQKLLVVKSKNDRWIFPKGGVKTGEMPHNAAAREAFEEGGVHGNVEIEPFCTEKGMRFYLMNVERLAEAYDEAKKRERKAMKPIEVMNDPSTAKYVKEVTSKLIKQRLADMDILDDFDFTL